MTRGSAVADTDAEAWQGAIIDIDGTLVLGDPRGHGYRALPGAVALIEAVREAGLRLAAFTNGTMHTNAEYVSLLAQAGLELAEHEVFTPANVAAQWYLGRARRRVLVLGGPGVWQPLRAAGLQVSLPDDGDAAVEVDEVLVGWHPEFRLSDLEVACRAVWAGARLGTTSNARFFASRAGRMIGVSNAIAAGITSTTGARARVFGKPSALAMRTVLAHLDVAAQRTLVVGDDPTLEIAMGRAAGARALGVLTGIGTADAFAAAQAGRRADALFDDAAGVATWLRGARAGGAPKARARAGRAAR